MSTPVSGEKEKKNAEERRTQFCSAHLGFKSTLLQFNFTGHSLFKNMHMLLNPMARSDPVDQTICFAWNTLITKCPH
jgi:hypothetical protein